MPPKFDLEALLARRIVKQPNGCWIWTGSKTLSNYGQIRAEPGGPRIRVHRLMYERANGPIPDGLTIDHLCHTNDLTCWEGDNCPHRLCCNPDHLEAVSNHANSARQHHAKGAWTHCMKGHEFTPENTKRRSGRRVCRTCDNDRKRAYYYANRVAKKPRVFPK